MIKRFLNKLHTAGNKGFTLVELIVAMTLTAIFATAVVAIMPSASRVFMQIENLGRAEMVADMVVDSLREECADTYIEDYASARIISLNDSGAAPEDASDLIGDQWGSQLATSEGTIAQGNVLLIRKTGGYSEAIYSALPITVANRTSVYNKDQSHAVGVESSRAVYRLFDNSNGFRETYQGYVHFGYFKNAFNDAEVDAHPEDASNTDKVKVPCFYPYEQYDYTTPFPADAYNGYIVYLEFSNMTYTSVMPGVNGAIYKRPSGVDVTVYVYKAGSYAGKGADNLLYTRNARLVFAEDTTK